MVQVSHAGQEHDKGRRFALAFGLTILILAVEFIGGLMANSLALLSDAGHVVTDVCALGLGWFAAAWATHPANAKKTWGYHRLGIVVALLNALMLVGITIFIVVEAVARLRAPEHVSPLVMGAAALFGIGVNLIIARFLSHTHAHDHEHETGVAHAHEGQDLNTRAALLHVLGDVGASAGVVLGAIIIALTGNTIFDALLSMGIAVLLAFGAWRVGRDALDVLLEATPKDIIPAQVEADLQAIPGIYAVHHLHVWGITDTRRALSCHAVIDDVPLSRSTALLAQMNSVLRERYGIGHATVQFEERGLCQHGEDCVCGDSDDCACEMDPVAEIRHSASVH
jgi:cobalt-zinc-cadmium efflux system protein